MMRTSNPAMNPAIFQNERAYGDAGVMTIQGTVNKCFVLFFLLMISASWVWGKLMQPVGLLQDQTMAANQTAQNVLPFILGGAIVGLVLGLVTVFKRQWAMYTSPAYALAEGLVLGGISAIYEHSYPGIVIQAVGLTFATLFCMLFLYKSGIIKVTKKFVLGITAATGAVFLFYFVSWIMGAFFGGGMSIIHSSGTFGIGFSLVVVAIAAFNLVLDFHIIEVGSEQGAPKYMEWYGAFALMVTMVWLYLEILRLLAKTRRR